MALGVCIPMRGLDTLLGSVRASWTGTGNLPELEMCPEPDICPEPEDVPGYENVPGT